MERSSLELPSRLLSLDPTNRRRIRLLDTCNITPAPVYMTLSHCWGTAKFLTLNGSTCERLREGIDVFELPQTFRDAVRVALQLGAKYLVCIS